MLSKIIAVSRNKIQLTESETDVKVRKHLYEHRDKSWMAFNARILKMAMDQKIPLLERIKFLAIAANNLAEFMEVRFAEHALLATVHHSKQLYRDKFGYTQNKIAHGINATVTNMYGEMASTYERLLASLLDYNVRVLALKDMDTPQREALAIHYANKLKPLFNPEYIDKHSPEHLHSRHVAFAMQLASGKNRIVPLPQGQPRFIALPDNRAYQSFIMLDTVMQENMQDIMQTADAILEMCELRIFRNSSIWLSGDHDQDVELEEKLKARKLARAVWLEYAGTAPPSGLVKHIADIVHVPKEYRVPVLPMLDMSALFGLYSAVSVPTQKYSGFIQQKRVEVEDIFARIRHKDIMLHYPFAAFDPVIEFLSSAADDPSVKAIRTTVYRVSKDSRIMEALKHAALNGKDVTVMVELKARYDEAQNLKWTRELEEAGCKVVHSSVDLKVHAKFAMVLREEQGKILPYVYMATGNLNEDTAQLYTDIGYFLSVDNGLADEFIRYFNYLTTDDIPTFDSERLLVGQGRIKQRVIADIEQEIAVAQDGGQGIIRAKMNGLEDLDIIDTLYAASSAGVKIELVVRGICSLIPGVPGLSENITVRSVTGRFLEHSRIFAFGNTGDLTKKRVYIGSADWMERNLDKREELMFEVREKDNKQQLLDILEVYVNNSDPQNYFLQSLTLH